jgi:GAF domain-containing protein
MPRTVLRAILKIIIQTVGAASGDISLLNPDTGKLEIEIADDADPESNLDLSLRLGQGITGWVAFHGRPQLVQDVALDPRYVRIRDHVKTEMVSPMIGSNGHIMGVINIDGDRIGQFSDVDLALLIDLTAEATTVMERHWELKNLRGKAVQLGSLITIGQTLVTKLEAQELFNSITRDAREITNSRACALYLHDEENRTARIVAYDGPADSRVPHVPLPLDSCLVASAIHTRKAIEYGNVQSPEFVDVIDLPHDPTLRSILVSPLLIENDVLGVLVVFTDHIHRFNNDEKRLLDALASLGAVALQNARLYARVFQSEATLRKNEQLTTLGLLAAEIAHEIRNPLTPQHRRSRDHRKTRPTGSDRVARAQFC